MTQIRDREAEILSGIDLPNDLIPFTYIDTRR